MTSSKTANTNGSGRRINDRQLRCQSRNWPLRAKALMSLGRRSILICMATVLAVGDAYARTPPPGQPQIAPLRDGQHDFDWEFGVWKTHLRRLLHPLTGSNEWASYDGTTTVTKVWCGRANLVQLDINSPDATFHGLSLRLYNPQSHQWSTNFSNAAVGTMSAPTTGEFLNGVGEFYDQEEFGGRFIVVRFVISHITPTSAHFEQSFSADGGRTWELNWIADDTRVGPSRLNRTHR
jgi:hypothetical protein